MFSPCQPNIETARALHWNLVEDTKHKKTWANNEQTALVGVQFSDNHPTHIPDKLEDINTIRNHYRNMIVEQFDGGLIHCEIEVLKGNEVIEMIVKQPNQTSGMTEAIILNRCDIYEERPTALRV